MKKLSAATLHVALLILATPAQAHLVNTRFGDFYAGFVHPITALEHIVPWLALGLLIGSQPEQRGRWGLASFACGLSIGLLMSVFWGGYDVSTMVNYTSFVILGALLALALPLPTIMLAAITLSFGISHGYGNGAGISDDTNIFLYVPGVVTSGYLIALFLASLTTELSARWEPVAIGVRAIGSWVLAIGIMLIGFNVAT